MMNNNNSGMNQAYMGCLALNMNEMDDRCTIYGNK